MTTIEYLLNKIPYKITKEETTYCYSCKREHTEQKEYRLKMDIVRMYNINNKHQTCYRLYYSSGLSNIGNAGGMGFKTLKEALKDLMRYKNKIRGEK